MHGHFGLFVWITLSLLIPSIVFQVILSTINAFRAFDYVYVLTQIQGGGSSVPTLVFNMCREGFNNFRMGNASAQCRTRICASRRLAITCARISRFMRCFWPEQW